MGFTTSGHTPEERLHRLRRRTLLDAIPLAGVILALTGGGWWMSTSVDRATKTLTQLTVPSVNRMDHLEGAIRELTEHLDDLANENDPERRAALTQEVARHLSTCQAYQVQYLESISQDEDRQLYASLEITLNEMANLAPSLGLPSDRPSETTVRIVTEKARKQAKTLADWNQQRAVQLTREVHDTAHLAWWVGGAASLLALGLFGRFLARILHRQRDYLHELQAQESQMHTLVDSSLDAIIAIDEGQRIIVFNQSAERMFQFSSGEVLGKTLDLLIPEASRGIHPKLVSTFIHRGGPGRMMGSPGDPGWVTRGFGRRKDGALFPIESSLSRMKIDGQIICTSQVRDITVRRQMEAAMEEAKATAEAAAKAKGEFLALVSHEIRTPLNGVIGLLHQLGKHPTDAAASRQITLAQDNAHHLLRILNDILDFSKIEADQVALESIPFDLHALLEQLHHLYQTQGASQGLSVIWQADATLPRKIIGDPLRLRQILGNLLHNALKFTAVGQVTMEVRRVGGEANRIELEFTVRDTGIGMSPEAVQRLFTPYAQADRTTARRFGGTGLGLSICHRLVTLKGGSLQAVSNLGEGSTFTVRLGYPTVEDEDTNLLVQVPEVIPSRWRGRVLVVDDEEINRLVCESWLQDAGVTTILASSGAEALELLKNGPVDLILTDIQMPDMDGIELLNRLGEDAKNKGRRPIPCIAVTGSVMPDEIERWRAAGFTGVLAKPLQGGELYTVLSALLPEALAEATPPEPSQADANALLDTQLVNRWRSLGQLGDLRAAFTTSLGQRLAQLRAGPTAPEARQQLHALTGAAANLGLSAFAHVSRTLEAQAAQGLIPESAAIEDLAAVAQKSLEALNG